MPARGQTRVVVLGAAAVVLAGLMFPATGFGTLPGPASAPPSADANAPFGSDAESDDGSPPIDTGTPTDSESTGTDQPTRETPTPTPTPTATPGPTTTEPPGGEDDDGSGLPGVLFGLSGAVLASVLLLVPGGVLLAVEGKHRGWPVFRALPVPGVPVTGLTRSVAQGTVATLVRTSVSVPRVLAGLGSVTAAATDALGSGLSGLARGVGEVVVAVPRGLAAGVGGLGSALAGILAGTERRTSNPASGQRPGEDPRTNADGSESEGDSRAPPATIEEAWRRMVAALSVRGSETRTPTEIAAAAVERGLPAGPVERLTTAVQQVAYGGYDATDERTDRALSAYERIRRALEGDR